MTHASLFSGIGGFDLAAQWAGWTNLFNCEIDPFCQKILKYHFPNAVQYADIRTTDFTVWRGRIDVLTGGFPCQPFSLAGKRRGTEDERYLWPAMLAVIRTVRPRWIISENVLGIVNWSGGMVFEQVCADLEAEGYEVQPFVIPACGVGAPHRRYRVWFVAHLIEDTECVRCDGDQPEKEPRVGGFGKSGAGDNVRVRREKGVAADSCGPRLEGSDESRCGKSGEWLQIRRFLAGCCDEDVPDWENFPAESPVCGRDDGLSDELDDITFSAWCRESIKSFGNAVVPQVPLQFFETINEYERIYKQHNTSQQKSF